MEITFSSLPKDTIINHKYKIIKLIGQGGFGDAYLAELINTGDKRLLKEFAPKIVKAEAIKKAQELFNREVGILQQLNHPQIPKFYELLPVVINGENRLFFVQEYIEGNTYTGLKLSQDQIIKFLEDILPVLSYLHRQNVIHRDISPDNILKRNQDQKPILIDFGAVKIASNQASQLWGGINLTKIGKTGYVPSEQIVRGQAFPCSDLYALGVTCLVLLTGENPYHLQSISSDNLTVWHWEDKVNIDYNLAKILKKMIEENYFHRYQSADEILADLHSSQLIQTNQNKPQFPPKIPTTLTVLVPDPPTKFNLKYLTDFTNKISSFLVNFNFSQILPAKNTNPHPTPVVNLHQKPINQKYLLIWLRKTVIIVTIILLPGIITFSWARGLLHQNQSEKSEICPNYDEIKRRDCIDQKASQLYANQGLFYQEVDRLFYQKYPELKGRKLTNINDPQEVKLRNEWYAIAENLLQEKSQ